ncbi:DUF6092 family protein [Spirillospora sp. NPDC049652]
MTATPDTSGLETELVQLAAHLLHSGRDLLLAAEPDGPLRLMDAARRTLALLESQGTADPHYSAVRARIEEARRSGEDIDVPAFLDTLCLQMARGLKAEAGPA